MTKLSTHGTLDASSFIATSLKRQYKASFDSTGLEKHWILTWGIG